MNSSLSGNTEIVKSAAKALGFDYCGISKADFLKKEAPILEQWLKDSMHGKMEYMERNFDKRLDPRKLVEGTRSVITLLLNYYPEETPRNDLKISKYAYGEDYHEVIRDKLNRLLDILKIKIGDVHGRGFVDSAPVMDKAWAERGGVGWIGKNANLINKNSGSFFFVANLLIDIPLEYDGPVKNYCGTCTKCIDACPTEAIVSPYVINANKCISYLTIELKDEIPQEFQNKMDGWIFGCDVCQDVCPWNRFSLPHLTQEFKLNEWIANGTKEALEELQEETFKIIFKKSAIKRTKLKGLKRNIKFIKI